MEPMLRAYTSVMAWLAADEDRDRGDVPGWVMVTLMSALLVVGLLVVFRTQVTKLVQDAFSSIQ